MPSKPPVARGLAGSHGHVHRDDRDLEGFLHCRPDLSLISPFHDLKNVLVLSHQVSVLLGNHRSAEHLVDMHHSFPQSPSTTRTASAVIIKPLYVNRSTTFSS